MFWDILLCAMLFCCRVDLFISFGFCTFVLIWFCAFCLSVCVWFGLKDFCLGLVVWLLGLGVVCVFMMGLALWVFGI